MDFKVITDAEGSFDNFTGNAKFKVIEGGALEVTSPDRTDVTRVVYGPHGWFRIDVTKDLSRRVGVVG